MPSEFSHLSGLPSFMVCALVLGFQMKLPVPQYPVHLEAAPYTNNAYYTYQTAYHQIRRKKLLQQVEMQLPQSNGMETSDIHTVLEANRPAIHTIMQGLKQPFICKPVKSFSTFVPNFMFRADARLLELKRTYMEQQGMWYEAAVLGLDIEKLGIQVPHNGGEIEELVGIAITDLATENLPEEISHLTKSECHMLYVKDVQILDEKQTESQTILEEHESALSRINQLLKLEPVNKIMYLYPTHSTDVNHRRSSFLKSMISTRGKVLLKDTDTMFNEESKCLTKTYGLNAGELNKVESMRQQDPIASIFVPSLIQLNILYKKQAGSLSHILMILQHYSV